MGENLIFKKIKYRNIFCDDYENFECNNILKFEKKIVVLYGPNGTGKTSLSKVLKSGNEDPDMSYEVEVSRRYRGQENSLFHVISDQNSRNIIEGEAKDYLIGDNIAREDELLKKIENGFNEICDLTRNLLKHNFKITLKSHYLISRLKDDDLKKFLSDFANNKFKASDIDKEKYIEKIKCLNKVSCDFNPEDETYKYILENSKNNDSIIYKIVNLDINDINKNSKIKEIEENESAIHILNKFGYKHECIVCDNKDYDREKLLESKQKNKIEVENALDDKTKKILDEIIKLVKKNRDDPLEIEQVFLEAIKTGNRQAVIELQKTINLYLKEIENALINLLKDSVSDNLISQYDEYKNIIEERLEISEEDILYIQEFITENIDKEIKIDRDQDKKIKITLDGSELLEVDREELRLSTGQQNFISLAFELLKAKKSDKPYIVLDDPISSFDSIFKNKIAFCIIKFLSAKKQIILTHNTELIKLLEFQNNSSFELYLFNNKSGSKNGFINVNNKEKELLLKLNKLLDLFRGSRDNIEEFIKEGNEKLFLISMIPFMRGYANIIGESDIYSNLSKVMHGYENEFLDISEVYYELFKNKICDEVNISVNSILEICLDDDEILDKSKYPLLNRTLYHTLNYLVLRLKVEQTLCSLDNNKLLNEINALKQGGNFKGFMTQQIIDKVFPVGNTQKIKDRVFFTSKKTLLNEFNHFEGNMNIFQPAIDITDNALEREKELINKKLEEIVRYDLQGIY